LTLLVKEARRKKFAEIDRPRSSSKAAQRTTRHVPAEIKRAVSTRDDGRCAFVAQDGRRCGTRDFLEFHHKEPWARARRPEARNIELRCRAHNAHAAEHDFGSDFMARFRRPERCELAPGPVERID
jgi:hypothetical protein